jgi:outer membrane protein TolC
MKLITIIFLTLLLSNVYGQSYNIEALIDSALINYPIYKQYQLNKKKNNIELQKIKFDNFPDISLSAQAQWQSEVMKIDIDFPPQIDVELPNVPQDQYKASLDIKQSIYKGGLAKKQIEISNLDKKINDNQTEVELYKLKQRLITYYYQLILLDKQREIFKEHQETLKVKLDELKSLINNGMVLSSAADKIEVELIDIDNQLVNIEFEKQKALQSLSRLCGFELNQSAEFDLPEFEVNYNKSIERLELKNFSLQQNKLSSMQSLINSKKQPMVFAFGQAGYGRPGLNYFSDKFTDYYIVGASLKWNIFNWNNFEREKEILNIQSQNIELQKETFKTEIDIASEEIKKEIGKQNNLIANDKTIIELRQKIASTSSQQLNNGLITSSEYLKDLNKLNQAKINAHINKIKLSLAEANYLWINGFLNF